MEMHGRLANQELSSEIYRATELSVDKDQHLVTSMHFYSQKSREIGLGKRSKTGIVFAKWGIFCEKRNLPVSYSTNPRACRYIIE